MTADIFISYARDDDEPFVRRLYQDLTDLGHEVWWDRAAMESRGRSFLQEIRDAIAEVERLILVVGPAAVAETSEYVAAEWRYALEMEKVVVPILRLGEFDLVPGPLSRLHCPDFRDTRDLGTAMNELDRLLREPIPPLGTVHGAAGILHHSSEAALLRGRLEKYYRMSLVLTFGGGTNEIQRDIICQAGLRMPRLGRR